FRSTCANFWDVSKEGDDCCGERCRPCGVGSECGAYHQREDAQHARGLLDVRRISGERECAASVLARRVDRRERKISGQSRAWVVSEAYGEGRCVGMSAGHDASLYNEDLAPIPLEKRTWGTYNYASLWVAMSVCIPTYMLASGLIASGMSWKQAIGTILLGNLIVLVPMVL